MKNINKYFPGVHALKDVDFQLEKGEVHALMGENGAGKSTLMKILTGVLVPDTGTITYLGQTYQKLDVSKAQDIGISMIYQELNLVPFLTVAENIYLGREPQKNGMLDSKKMYADAQNIFDSLGVSIDSHEKVKNLSVAYQQIVEVAKAISQNAQILIMDEPTGPLANDEVELLFKLVAKLKNEGVSIVYISHRMEEIFRICDRITVFRDGTFIQTLRVSDTDRDGLIKLMVGRDLTNQYPPQEAVGSPDDIKLELRNICNAKLKDISFTARNKEILGIAGLVGAGRTELARAICGADTRTSGTIIVQGKQKNIRYPWDAIKEGIVLLPEDRKQQGLLLKMTVQDNITMPVLKRMRRKVFLDNKKCRKETMKLIQNLRIKTPSEKQIAKNLSGGNQQKLVVARWILSNADIIIFDEPTRGIDVGAKYEIYSLMNELKSQGKTIIMISSDMPELIGMSDRICVMCNGRLSGILEHDEISQESIMKLATDF